MENVITNATARAINETLIGDFSSYFRWNDSTRQYEINRQIDPRVEREDWVVVTGSARDLFCDPNCNLPLGNIIYRYADAELRNDRQWHRINTLTHSRDTAMKIIGDRLIEEAESRGWCAEFDEIIEEVNAELPSGWELPTRKREYEVQVTVTGKITTTTTVTVEASSEQAARDMVNEDTEDHVDLDEALTEKARRETFEITDIEIGEVSEA